jgi:iron complex transport system substrate-binding protein
MGFSVVVVLLSAAGCTRQPDVSKQQGERIISLAPSLTEMIYAVGGGNLLVGRTTYCDYPLEARSVPVVGGFGAPSLEKLVALQPTLVLELGLDDATLARKIDEAGLKRKRINCSLIDDIPTAVREVGRFASQVDNADRLAARISDEIQLVRKQAEVITNRPKVYVEIWGDPLMTVGRKSFVSELVHLSGGVNIGDETETPYFQVSSEWVMARNPDIILCFYMGASVPASDAVLKRSGWNAVEAVRTKRVYDGFKNDVILRPGPRVLEGITQLRETISGKGADK